MRPSRFLLVIIGLAILAVAILFLNKGKEEPGQPISPSRDTTHRELKEPPRFAANLPPVREDRSDQFLQNLNHSSSTIQKDLEIVWHVVESFNNTLKHNGTIPMGSNRELTLVLFGRNPRGIRFVDPGKPYISPNGELLDRWDTPFFFHFVEGSEIAIRSAGKDGIMWNDDDITYGKFAHQLE